MNKFEQMTEELAIFMVENGIKLEEHHDEIIKDTYVQMYKFIVFRNDRTDDEIDKLMRIVKVRYSCCQIQGIADFGLKPQNVKFDVKIQYKIKENDV